MIIAAVADTHGHTEAIIKLLQKLRPDHILFAGDFYQDGQTIGHCLNLPTNIVGGNCDFNHRSQQEEIVTLMNHRILLVHGHQYGVKKGFNRIYYRARELEVEAVVFGHTHYPFCEQSGDLWLVNPGSPVLPRYPGAGTYAIIEIDAGRLLPHLVYMKPGEG